MNRRYVHVCISKFGLRHAYKTFCLRPAVPMQPWSLLTSDKRVM